MPSYKLHYMNGRGRAEISRLIFALADVEYEDKRYTREEWVTVKESGLFPFKQVPVLEFDGEVLAQTNAVARYLANEYGYMGKNNLENAKIDMIVDMMKEFADGIQALWYEKDEAKQAEMIEKFKTKTMIPGYSAMKKILAANEGDGFFLGDKVTMADLSFVTYNEFIVQKIPDALDNYPMLKELTDRVLALPKIAEWVKKRPETTW
ncbi:S-crystallin SL11-like [Saccoglossus kowalevskii]|uniref:S-crystallin SL11-like n=1 Tax=Saccoglossus kowalevskii TaxID=10224 RepID=A0ABM0GJX7_SACKO|nr:PREDICTED: S-crystallin SL11-like [Saccoglossus kowalevskii]